MLSKERIEREIKIVKATVESLKSSLENEAKVAIKNLEDNLAANEIVLKAFEDALKSIS